MFDKVAQRRFKAESLVLARQYGLHDPIYNLREIVKQMLLLEDHLYHKDKFCQDCICKHILTIEALAEEMISLGTTVPPIIGEFVVRLTDKWFDKLTIENAVEAADAFRHYRKILTKCLKKPDLIQVVAETTLQKKACKI